MEKSDGKRRLLRAASHPPSLGREQYPECVPSLAPAAVCEAFAEPVVRLLNRHRGDPRRNGLDTCRLRQWPQGKEEEGEANAGLLADRQRRGPAGAQDGRPMALAPEHVENLVEGELERAAFQCRQLEQLRFGTPIRPERALPEGQPEAVVLIGYDPQLKGRRA